MPRILFFDIEINKKTRRVEKTGAVFDGVVFRDTSIKMFEDFSQNATYICGHNIINHDLEILKNTEISPDFFRKKTRERLNRIFQKKYAKMLMLSISLKKTLKRWLIHLH
ncbi:MAG: hypothetical protein H8D45_29425 [Bacteroidetes bacterium]|nr:hypothetical protein [Bacteroidota bacterium]MBL7105615.1 hypothetical protein [Bacteroidales bacterium]